MHLWKRVRGMKKKGVVILFQEAEGWPASKTQRDLTFWRFSGGKMSKISATETFISLYLLSLLDYTAGWMSSHGAPTFALSSSRPAICLTIHWLYLFFFSCTLAGLRWGFRGCSRWIWKWKVSQSRWAAAGWPGRWSTQPVVLQPKKLRRRSEWHRRTWWASCHWPWWVMPLSARRHT